MSELIINLAGEDFHMTPENTYLFTFVGRTVLREEVEIDAANCDHIFFVRGETEGGMQGTYHFKKNPITGEVSQSYVQLRAFMEEHRYTLHLNQREVPECDKDALWNAYFKNLFNDIRGTHTVPEGWTDGNS